MTITNNELTTNVNIKPLVTIICHTFNHENYIKNAIDGFLIQKVNFLYEIIIHDDASTDTTKKIIDDYVIKYPNLIKPIFQKENQFSKKKNISANFTYPKAQGKYIALCEGDDYWTDENKLQKQIDFLETNSNYVITWTNFITKNNTNFVETEFENMFPEVYSIDFENLFEVYNTFTLTCVFKKDAIEYNRILDFKFAKDNTVYALTLINGKGAFLNFKSAVYRWHSGGIYSLQPVFSQRFSSYKNLKEILTEIPESRTKNIYRITSELLKVSAFEVLKIKKTNIKLTKEHIDCVLCYLHTVKLKRKLKFILIFGILPILKILMHKLFKFENN